MIKTIQTTEHRTPTDLRKALAATPKVSALWKNLTPIARRDFITWVESTKQPETRKRRVESMASRLAAGKRRPCCFALVPMNFYKALNGTLKAKQQWKDLTPTEKRDFVAWVTSAREPEQRRVRVEKAVLVLAAGKRRPRF